MAKKRRKKPIKSLYRKFPGKMRKKLVGVFGAVLLVFVIFIGKTIWINALHGEEYQKRIMNQMSSQGETIRYKRGDILDANGSTLATSTRTYNVILDVNGLLQTKSVFGNKKIDATVEALVEAFDLNETELRQKIQENEKSHYVMLKKNASYEEGKKFKELQKKEEEEVKKNIEKKKKVKGEKTEKWIVDVTLEESYVRTYPYDMLASDVIGFASSENVGNTGLEASYNEELNGVDGRKKKYVESGSDSDNVLQSPVNGNNIVTTLDVNLQSIVEKHIKILNEKLRDNHHEGPGTENTAVMIMDPNTGAILAEASYPNFNLNDPWDVSKFYTSEQWEQRKKKLLDKYPDKGESLSEEEKDAVPYTDLWKNFCVTDTFEPGSTMKPFTMAAGFETGKLDGNEVFVCNGSYKYEGVPSPVSCIAKNGHGKETLKQVLENSCNVGMMEIAEKLGKEDFSRYQHIFGFGEYTGIDLPGEVDTSAVLYSPDQMKPIDLGTNSFGQNFEVTMTQLASAFCSLINGGNYYDPYLVPQIVDENGSVIETKKPVLKKKTVSKETSDILKDYMYGVVEEGSGKGAKVEGYAIGGKTGTAEKRPREEGKNLNSFIGYAPQENPEVMIYVIVDEPNLEQQAASYLATDLAADIMKEAFPYLNITKTE